MSCCNMNKRQKIGLNSVSSLPVYDRFDTMSAITASSYSSKSANDLLSLPVGESLQKSKRACVPLLIGPNVENISVTPVMNRCNESSRNRPLGRMSNDLVANSPITANHILENQIEKHAVIMDSSQTSLHVRNASLDQSKINGLIDSQVNNDLVVRDSVGVSDSTHTTNQSQSSNITDGNLGSSFCLEANNICDLLLHTDLFRLPSDSRPGFDTVLQNDVSLRSCGHTFDSVPSEYIEDIRSRYGKGGIDNFDKPYSVNRNNVNEFRFLLNKSFSPTDIWVFFESRANDVEMAPPKKGESSMNTSCLRERCINSIIGIQPPSSGKGQVYCVDSGAEYHGDEHLDSMFNFIQGTNITLILYPNEKTCAAAHAISINDQEAVGPFLCQYDIFETMSLVKTHGSNRTDSEGCNVWQQSKATDIGVCCF